MDKLWVLRVQLAIVYGELGTGNSVYVQVVLFVISSPLSIAPKSLYDREFCQ